MGGARHAYVASSYGGGALGAPAELLLFLLAEALCDCVTSSDALPPLEPVDPVETLS